jgi:tRNA(Ile)-lysidine synthase
VTRNSQDGIQAANDHWLKTLAEGTHICVAYSGGVDSSVLLHALGRAREKHANLQLSAIHIHHGLSPNADAWAAHCETTCKALNVPLSVVRVDVQDKKKLGTEAAARAARYDALRTHARTHLATIALAHHARDQAETVLLQLLRGSGPAGLAAMPENTAPFARPLLHVAKAVVDAYAATHSIAHIVDESNADTRYTRNRLRNHVWPVLVENFESAERTLSRAATWQQESDELATALAEIDLANATDGDALIAYRWRTLSSARRRNALRHWLQQRGIELPSSERLLEWERQLISENATQNLKLTHASFEGSIRRYRDRIEFVPQEDVTLDRYNLSVAWRGESEIPFGKRTVRFHEITQKTASNTNLLRPIQSGEAWNLRLRQDKDKIYLSPAKIGRSMKNLFQDFDVPPWLRSEWPMLTCDGKIAAVPGLAIAHEFRAKHDEQGYLLSWE